MTERTCLHCQTPILLSGNQRYCVAHGWGTPAYTARQTAGARQRKKPRRDAAKQREYRRRMRERTSAPRPTSKTCPCGAVFAVEFDSRGQMTQRVYCDACRTVRRRGQRRHDRPPEFPPETPRCQECEALVGLQYGTVTHLDSAGRCPACARWEIKRQLRANKEAA